MGNQKKGTGVSRRQFLAGSLGAGALAAGSLAGLTACAAADSSGTSESSTDTSASNPTVAEGSDAQVRSYAAQLNPQSTEFRSNTTNFETLFSEWQFGKLTLPNRVVKSAAGVHGMWSDGPAGAEPLAYYGNLARGGCKLIYMDDIVEMYPHFQAIPEVGKMTDVSDDELKAFAKNIHDEGAYVGYQLASMGIEFSGFVPTGAMFQSSTCIDMTPEEIELFKEDTFVAAKRLQDCGFDCVELNMAGENIGQTFLSRNRNFREDDYGPQTLESRSRFIVEIIKGIKETCGADFPVQVLINGVEENDAAIGDSSLYTTVQENVEFAKIFEAAGADAIHVRIGPSGQHVCEFAGDLYFTGYGIEGTTSFGTQFDFSRHWQNKLIADTSGCGHIIDVAAEIKAGVSIPVGAVSYMDPAIAPDMMENALKDGKIDFMLMNRPLNVDYEYLTKLQEGRLDEVAPCTRCLHCHWDMDRKGEITMSCRVNAAFHRAYREPMPEGFEPTPAETSKKVMVVGGGPAGMEAARIAAQRGHEVTLYEKNSTLGGLLDFANIAKGQHENLDVFKNYLVRQLEVNGVTVVTGQEVDAAFIEQEAPEAVILAVGGLRDSSGLESSAGTTVIPIENGLGGDLSDDIVILGSNAQAIDMTMYLLAQGKHVQIVTPSPLQMIGDGHSGWVKTFVNPMIKALGTRIWDEAEITAIGEGEVTIKQSTGVEITVPCGTVIEAMDMLQNTELSEGLNVDVHVVGDADNPYNIANAVATGNLAARAL